MSDYLTKEQAEQITLLYKYNLTAKEIAIATKTPYYKVTTLCRALKAQETKQLPPGQLGRFIIRLDKESISDRNLE